MLINYESDDQYTSHMCARELPWNFHFQKNHLKSCVYVLNLLELKITTSIYFKFVNIITEKKVFQQDMQLLQINKIVLQISKKKIIFPILFNSTSSIYWLDEMHG